MAKKRTTLWIVMAIVGVLLLGGGIYAYMLYRDITAPNVRTELADPYIRIPEGTDLDGLVALFREGDYLYDAESFRFTAEQMDYSNVRPGRFAIEPGMSNRELVNYLKVAKQAPVNLVLTYGWTLRDVAAKASRYLQADSTEIYRVISDPAVLAEYDLTPETAMTAFIPNTYEVYWNTTPEEFLGRMVKERDRFWNQNNRDTKAKAMNRSREEVYTLASIVEKETNMSDERDRVAGVYLNRLRIGMPLQADPTVKFAVGDFGLRRILYKHLEVDSPYNTYRYGGLPPGPIAMASASSIDAVLTPEDHKYLYFAARPDNSGYHAFAKTLAQHNANARRYQSWLNQQGIR